MARTRALPALLLLSLSACSGTQYVSPNEPLGPPPFIGPGQDTGPAPDASQGASVQTAPPPPSGPTPLTFFRTQDSQEWVSKNFKVQSKYARVIAVYSGDKAPEKVSVAKLDLLAAPGTKETVEELPVTLAVRTLEEAAKAAKGGDLVAVLPGRYKGFTLGDKADAGDDRYIHFKAMGAPGDVIIDAPGSDPNWMILLQTAHHVIIQGFNLAGQNQAGDKEPQGPNAGILIDGDFGHSSRLSHHIAVIGNYSHGHKFWGIHSVDSHTVLVQDNCFADSAKEHSAYFSDGSDDYVIRRNVFYGSNASGLQINVDPLASLEKVAKHPAVEQAPMKPTREWALNVLKIATEKFGANAFPDGRGFNFIVEDNVINGNGRIGGAAINLAGVRESLIQNNLVYGNLSSGIAEWDNGNPFDRAAVDPGPQSAGDMRAENLPIFGCFNNVIRNNTILMAVKGRPALLVGNGSWGTRARNNVLVNDELPSVLLNNTSIWRFDGTHNVLDRVTYEGPAERMKTLAISLPDGPKSTTGISRSALAGSFVRPGEEPWVILDAKWWKLNPRRPDYHPRSVSSTLAGKGDPREMPRYDIEGKPRTKADIGAYVAAP
jgi:hypothetical protein